jgi:hypothetical protein
VAFLTVIKQSGVWFQQEVKLLEIQHHSQATSPWDRVSPTQWVQEAPAVLLKYRFLGWPQTVRFLRSQGIPGICMLNDSKADFGQVNREELSQVRRFLLLHLYSSLLSNTASQSCSLRD